MRADRELVWALLEIGSATAPVLREQIIGAQDTAELWRWREQAATVIEEISDELDGRGADQQYREREMQR